MKHNTQPQESKEPLGIIPDQDDLQLLADTLFAKKEDLITAYDNTYRKGYDPLRVDALYRALDDMKNRLVLALGDLDDACEDDYEAVTKAEQVLKNAKL